jgi:hypothetical protein
VSIAVPTTDVDSVAFAAAEKSVTVAKLVG